jgi:uncharacterized membrane protein (UPF0127 family)
MNKKILLTILAIIALLTLLFVLSKNFYTGKSDIDLRKFDTILADNSNLRELGLGKRDSLSENSIMLFVFDYPSDYAFWMKDMKFNIDIIWLDETYRVVYISENISPNTYPQVFSPDKKAKYVIEGNAFFARKNKIQIGDKVLLNKTQ